MSSELIFYTVVVVLISAGIDILIYKFNAANQNDELFRLKIEKITNSIKSRYKDLYSVTHKRWFNSLEKFKRHFVQTSAAIETNHEKVELIQSTEKHTVQFSSEQVPGEANGKIARVFITAEIPVGSSLQINISAKVDSGEEIQTSVDVVEYGTAKTHLNEQQINHQTIHSAAPKKMRENLSSLNKNILRTADGKFPVLLFILSIIVYLYTRFSGLVNYPIYFLGDEAVQTVSAMALLQNNWLGPNGQFLPTYFQNGAYYNLGTSVYLQIIPTYLFGNSVMITRGTFALLSLIPAITTGLILKEFFNRKRWWIATLCLSIIPAWFLHSRTAFETSVFVSFYSAFMYFYFAYRLRNPNNIFPAIISAALAFYSYSPGQMILGVSVLLLCISDYKYHLQQKKKFLPVFFLAIFVLLPYLRFRLANQYSPIDHLRQLGSYWIDPIPLPDKIIKFINNYLFGLSPQYWFFSGHEPVLKMFFSTKQLESIFTNSTDLTRHIMKGYGNISVWSFPIFLIGVILCLINIKKSASRNLLLLAFAVPSGAALVNIGITRVLVFIIPASLLISLGLEDGLLRLEKWIESFAAIQKFRFLNVFISMITFITLSGISLSILNDALKNGGSWFQDYSLYGMQYGSKQLFEDNILQGLKTYPDRKYVVSPSWANGTEQFTSFFLPSDLSTRVELAQPINYAQQLKNGLPNTIFVTTADEYNNLVINPEFTNIKVDKTILYPNGQAGFYFITLQTVSNIEAIIAAEHEKNRTPIEEQAVYQGIKLKVLHSPFGIGSIENVFDSDSFTLVRSLEANPFLFDIYPEKPIATNSINIQTGTQKLFTVTISLYPVNSSVPVTYKRTFSGLPTDPVISFIFDKGPKISSRIKIELKDDISGEYSEIHVRTLEIK